MNILIIYGSLRVEDSTTYKFGSKLLNKLISNCSEPNVKKRYLNHEEFTGAPNNDWVKANQTPEKDRSDKMISTLNFSDELIAELKWANLILLCCPMYNFSVPWNVKAYIDLVIRVGHTFNFDSETNKFTPLINSKKLILITASAGSYSEPPMSSVDFCEPYLKSIFNFIGIDLVETLTLNNRWMSNELKNESDKVANYKINNCVKIVQAGEKNNEF